MIIIRERKEVRTILDTISEKIISQIISQNFL